MAKFRFEVDFDRFVGEDRPIAPNPSSAPAKPPIARAIRTTVRLLPRVSPGLSLACVAVVLGMAVVPNIFKVVTGAVVGTVVRHRDQGWDVAGGEAVAPLLLLGGLFALQQILGPIRVAVGDALGRALAGHLRTRAMAAAGRPAGISHLEDPEMLDRVSLAQGVGANNITPRGFVLGLTGISTRYLQATGSALLLIPYRWWLPVVMTAGFLLIIRAFHKEFKKQVSLMVGQAGTMRRTEYLAGLGLTPGAAKESRVFGLGEWIVERHRQSWLSAITGVWAERKGAWRVSVFGGGALTLLEFAAFAMLARSAARSEISIEQLTVYTQAVFGLGGFASLSDDDLNVEYASAAIPAVLDLERDVARLDVRPATPVSVDGRPRDAIRFEGVSFRYAGRDDDVMTGLDLAIPAGRSLAIVGENGAGKTTLVKMLAGLYRPTEGRITVDGVDLTDVDPDEWQARVAAIFQDFVRYQLSAAYNVGLGDTGPDPELLRQAAERAGALDIIEGLDSGWDTILSRQYEGGTDLSGGQWQRIALARAFYAVGRGAGVLVLDEPTANLDVRAEADLYERFLEITSGLTTILISHRFSTVRRADRIVVLDGGRVVEDGSHDELVRAGGRYARMFSLQAARFRDGDESEDDELAAVGEGDDA